MAYVAAGLFLVSAAIGAVMAVQRLKGTPTPATGLALTHGGLASVAVVLYGIALAGAEPRPLLGLWAIGLFIAAALGGALMFLAFHLRGRPLPVVLVLGHGGIALVAFVLLLFAIFGATTGGVSPY